MMPEERIDCAEVETSLTDFLEKSLSAPSHRRIETHLAQCPACRQLLNELETTIALLARLPKPQPPQPQRARPDRASDMQ